MSKQIKVPNIVRGGVAIPLKGKTNYYYMKGRKHSAGGIDIGKNPRTGLEVEDGEIMQITDKDVKVFSSVPFLNGKSPAQKVMSGENPTKVFAQQEQYKDRNGINDDGSRKKYKAKFGFDKKKIYNRLPANANDYVNIDPFGLSTSLSSLFKYFFNNDNHVNNIIKTQKDIIKSANIEDKNFNDRVKYIISKNPKYNKESAKRKILNNANEIIGLEDAKDIYLGMPQRSNTFIKSGERPTQGIINNPYKSKYLSSKPIIEQYLIPIRNKILTGFSNKNNNSKDIKMGKSGKNGVTTLPILGHSTVDIGTDKNKGDYISYYDKWDIDMSGKANTNDNVANIIGGKPFDIYDRIYLDDYYGIDSSANKGEYYGGYLPEVIIYNKKNNKRMGGEKDINTDEKYKYVTDDEKNKYTDRQLFLINRSRHTKNTFRKRNKEITNTKIENRKKASDKFFGSLNRGMNTLQSTINSQIKTSKQLGNDIKTAAKNQREQQLDKWHDYKKSIESTLTAAELISAGYGLGRPLLKGLGHNIGNTQIGRFLQNIDKGQLIMNGVGGVTDVGQFIISDNSFDKWENGIESIGDGIGVAGSLNILPNRYDKIADTIGYGISGYDLAKGAFAGFMGKPYQEFFNLTGSKNKKRMGGIDYIYKKVNKKNTPDFIRMRNPKRKSIPDWKQKGYTSTNKVAIRTDNNGKHFLYNDIQDNGKDGLIDMSNPINYKNGKYMGDIRAIERGDTIHINSIEDGLKFSKDYKKYYPGFEKRMGGKSNNKYKANKLYSLTVNGETKLKRFPPTGERTQAGWGDDIVDNIKSLYRGAKGYGLVAAAKLAKAYNRASDVLNDVAHGGEYGYVTINGRTKRMSYADAKSKGLLKYYQNRTIGGIAPMTSSANKIIKGVQTANKIRMATNASKARQAVNYTKRIATKPNKITKGRTTRIVKNTPPEGSINATAFRTRPSENLRRVNKVTARRGNVENINGVSTFNNPVTTGRIAADAVKQKAKYAAKNAINRAKNTVRRNKNNNTNSAPEQSVSNLIKYNSTRGRAYRLRNTVLNNKGKIAAGAIGTAGIGGGLVAALNYNNTNTNSNTSFTNNYKNYNSKVSINNSNDNTSNKVNNNLSANNTMNTNANTNANINGNKVNKTNISPKVTVTNNKKLNRVNNNYDIPKKNIKTLNNKTIPSKSIVSSKNNNINNNTNTNRLFANPVNIPSVSLIDTLPKVTDIKKTPIKNDFENTNITKKPLLKNTWNNLKQYAKNNPNEVADIVGLASNTIGSLITHGMNRNMLNRLKYSNAPIPIMASKLKTRININPQLDKMRESLSSYERNIDANTASSNVAIARKQRARANDILSHNELYGYKENTETELINKDRLNRQSVNAENIRNYNSWVANKAQFDNVVAEKKAENNVSLINNINTGIQDIIGRRERREADRQTRIALSAASPNVNPRILRTLGIKSITDEDIKRWEKAFGNR